MYGQSTCNPPPPPRIMIYTLLLGQEIFPEDEGFSGTAKKSTIIISWADPLHRLTLATLSVRYHAATVPRGVKSQDRNHSTTIVGE